MESILVTGGAGNIGSALVRALVGRPDTRLVVTENLPTGRLARRLGDVCRRERLVFSRFVASRRATEQSPPNRINRAA